jgi:DNA-binding transcriptional ArsR family regulator
MSAKRYSGGSAGAAMRRSFPLFAALGDPTRLRLVSRLCAGGPASITALSDGAGVTRQAVTKHLHILARAGLVRSARRGRESIWELEPARIAEARQYLDSIARQWDQALGKLKRFVEEDA